MASLPCIFTILVVIFFPSQLNAKLVNQMGNDQSQKLTYHNGPLLSGKITINLLWYGSFKPAQKAIVTDFIGSLSSPNPGSEPSVGAWWKMLDQYYTNDLGKPKPQLSLGQQTEDVGYSMGKSLTSVQVAKLATRGGNINTVNVLLTDPNVTVDGFCRNRCGTHGSGVGSNKFTYIWVGNSETQCPGYCAWPFHRPIYGPQNPPLVAPNGDVGLDGMIMSLGSMLAGTVTNPFGNGYYQGSMEAPLEAASACPGVFGKGAYPGYPGNLLVDSATGASYNSKGNNGRKFLLPALFDLSTSTCATLT